MKYDYDIQEEIAKVKSCEEIYSFWCMIMHLNRVQDLLVVC